MSDQGSPTTKTPDVRDIAHGVRQVAVGEPFFSYAYLIDSPEGIVAFDAGVRGSGPEILAAAGGPIAKVILSHAHADHRGAAPELGAPIYCHPDEIADAKADWPQSYLDFSLIENQRIREGLPRLNQTWDSGPLEIAGTIEEGDEVAGMQVIHVPGHAPGEIALFRASDGLLLAGDAIYTQDAETGDPGPARVPNQFANWNTEQARASIRKLATYKPTSVWLGHSTPVTGDVDAQLEAAAGFDENRSAGNHAVGAPRTAPRQTAMSMTNDETLVGRWQLDPRRSSVEFRVGHLWGLVTVKGRFEDYEGRLDLSGDPALELTIDAASVQTGNRKRDQHLRSADFFEAENHPRVRFVSDSVVLQGKTLKVRGCLFARDQSIPLELDAHVRQVDDELEIEAATSASHRKLGMTWSPLGMIPPRSELLVTGYLVPATEQAA